MKQKIIKPFLIYISIFLVFFLTSCDFRTTIINEVINRDVVYSDDINILDFEEQLVLASTIAKESSVGIETISGVLGAEENGSGVIINCIPKEDNLYEYIVITNRHVITRGANVANEIYVYLGVEGEKYEAKVLTYDEKIDVGFVSFTTGRIINVVKICETNVETGRFVICVGCPYKKHEYFNSVTIGNISSDNRILKEKDTYDKECINTYFQHDASINVGNSGGGAFNIKGELVGINSLKVIADNIEGIALSIKITDVYPLYQSYFMSEDK